MDFTHHKLHMQIENRPECDSCSKQPSDKFAWLEFFKKQFANISATYRQKGLLQEADIFDEIVEEFEETTQETKELSS